MSKRAPRTTKRERRAAGEPATVSVWRDSAGRRCLTVVDEAGWFDDHLAGLLDELEAEGRLSVRYPGRPAPVGREHD